ncbi:60S ribosomal protein [Vigna angularis]|uniref:60S ribosomal protein n=1 Tax=Phaseolus angularis TaxID=3914 RepID=A0A8T0K5A8_PHAAN|nr:60S ribosomal protein [Vigna angularis]
MVKGRQGERVRLYVRGSILGYKRSKSNQYPNTSLIQIENVNSKEEVAWYAGKRMAYIYKAKVKKNGSHYRCIWGKVTRPHGNSGVVRAKFKSNLPPRSMGARIASENPFCLSLLLCPWRYAPIFLEDGIFVVILQLGIEGNIHDSQDSLVVGLVYLDT